MSSSVLIPEHKIQEVIERIDIVAVVSRHVELKKSGRSFKGRCPFHQEKSASFHVTPELRRYKCFGCQAGGDAISFVQRYLGKTFIDAVRDLAREAGVDLEAAVDPAARERQFLKEATDFAQEFFKSRLWHDDIGQKARSYLQSRGVSLDVAKAFGLGWAPLAWGDLAQAFTERGWLDYGVKAGLIAPRQKSEGYYDLFRGRLMIPIRSPEGRTIAFGGRLLEGDQGPKYLNSRESKLYNKSETLYGLDVAREDIRKKKSAVLVEGYFDCIGLYQAGVKNTVALCSTALTPGHLAQLARAEAKELVLLLDGDDAGRKAVERLAGALLAQGTSTRVALLPEGQDPDTFARTAQISGLTDLLQAAPPLSQHLLNSVLPNGVKATFEEKMQALDRLKPIFAQLPVGLPRSALMGGVAAHFGLPASELETSLRGKVAMPPAAVPKPRPPPSAHAPVDTLEAVFAAFILKQPSLLAEDTFRVADELTHAGLRHVVAQVSHGTPPEEALYEASEAVKKALQDAARHIPVDSEGQHAGFGATCRRMKMRRIDEQLTHIAKMTAVLEGSSDLTDDTRRLLAERGELLALKRQVAEEKHAAGRNGAP